MKFSGNFIIRRRNRFEYLDQGTFYRYFALTDVCTVQLMHCVSPVCHILKCFAVTQMYSNTLVTISTAVRMLLVRQQIHIG